MTPESIRPGIPSVNESIAAIERLQRLEPLHDAALKEIEILRAELYRVRDLVGPVDYEIITQLLEKEGKE